MSCPVTFSMAIRLMEFSIFCHWSWRVFCKLKETRNKQKPSRKRKVRSRGTDILHLPTVVRNVREIWRENFSTDRQHRARVSCDRTKVFRVCFSRPFGKSVDEVWIAPSATNRPSLRRYMPSTLASHRPDVGATKNTPVSALSRRRIKTKTIEKPISSVLNRNGRVPRRVVDVLQARAVIGRDGSRVEKKCQSSRTSRGNFYRANGRIGLSARRQSRRVEVCLRCVTK